jgi:anti-sigma B factor antagonist
MLGGFRIRAAGRGTASRNGKRSLLMSSASRRRLRVETIDGVSVVSFVDSKIVADEAIEEVGEQLYRLVDRLEHKQILLNFGNVQYLSSSALGRLTEFRKKVRSVKGKVKLCCIHPELREAFRITGLEKIFEIYDEEQQALDTF